MYDLAVVGGGVAGLAVAEIFARSGAKVALIEANPKLCSEASGAQHGWYHFGSLYSIFPSPQYLRTMVEGVERVLEYYADFRGMNLRVDDSGALGVAACKDPWIRDEKFEYVVSATNDPDFRLKEATGIWDFFDRMGRGLAWDFVVKYFISRHNRFYTHDWRRRGAAGYIPKAGAFDYSRTHIEKYRNEDVRLDPDTHFKVTGYDRPMFTLHIMRDLLRSYLSNGGDLFLGTRYTGYGKDGGKLRIRFEGREDIVADKAVLAMGRSLARLSGLSRRFNVVASPLMVVHPSVCRDNFARLCPFVPKTVNHIWHSVEGRDYSLIGGGYFAKPDDETQLKRAADALTVRAGAVFPKLERARHREIYFGYKTEVVRSLGERNYGHQTVPLDDGLYAVLPGKFSLGFSLAVSVYQELMGRAPQARMKYDADLAVDDRVDFMRHQKIVLGIV